MYLKDKQSGDLVEVLDILAMVNPCIEKIDGRFHAGEEMQDAASFTKGNLEFPSGEALPRCWIDADYRGTTH